MLYFDIFIRICLYFFARCGLECALEKFIKVRIIYCFIFIGVIDICGAIWCFGGRIGEDITKCIEVFAGGWFFSLICCGLTGRLRVCECIAPYIYIFSTALYTSSPFIHDWRWLLMNFNLISICCWIFKQRKVIICGPLLSSVPVTDLLRFFISNKINFLFFKMLLIIIFKFLL